MTIERFVQADLSSVEVCTWLTGNDPTYHDTISLQDGNLPTDYTQSRKNPLLITADAATFFLTTFKEITYSVTYRGTDRHFADLKAVAGTQHELKQGVLGVLFTKNGIPVEQVSLIEKTFDEFKVDQSTIRNDVSDVEIALYSQGVAPDAYYLKLIFSLERVSAKTVFDSTPDLESVLHPESQYEARIKSEVVTCQYPDNVIDDEDTVEVGDIEDTTEVKDGIKKVADDRAAQKDCYGLIVDDTRIGTLYQYPEWKTVMENKEIRVGPCKIMKTKVPVVYHRTTKRALWAYTATESEAHRYLEKALRDCVLSAAATTGLLALVTGGMALSVAVAAWSAAFLECMKNKFEDGIRCIIHDCVLVTEQGDWEHGV